MASIILAAAGTAIGGSVGGSILGVSAAAIGGAVGSIAGAAIDSWLVASMAPTQRIAGQRLDTLQITSSTEGAVIPRVYGAMRTGGNIIWATDFREETRPPTRAAAARAAAEAAAPRSPSTSTSPSFAVALCEGPITGIGRIWADGKLMSRDGVTLRLHKGGEDQEPDPFIAAKMGAANTPAYRGTAYVVFEELPLERFGNRLPQLSFEVFRPILDGESAESLVAGRDADPGLGRVRLRDRYRPARGRRRRDLGRERQRRARRRRPRGRARPAGGLRAEGRVGLARRRLVRRRPARRPLPHPSGRRGQRQEHDAGELVGQRRRAAARRISSAATTRAGRPTAARRPTAPWCRRSRS